MLLVVVSVVSVAGASHHALQAAADTTTTSGFASTKNGITSTGATKTSVRDLWLSYTEAPVLDRWLEYAEPYQMHFPKPGGAPLRLLEIGVQSGGSAIAWQQYYGSSLRSPLPRFPCDTLTL